MFGKSCLLLEGARGAEGRFPGWGVANNDGVDSKHERRECV